MPGAYVFYIEYHTGEVTIQYGLTKRNAIRRYNQFEKLNYSDSVKEFGYKLYRDTLSQRISRNSRPRLD